MPRSRLLVIALAILTGGCSETKVTDSNSTCASSVTYSYEANSPHETTIAPGGSFILTFPFSEPVTISGLTVKSGVYDSPAEVTVKIYKVNINDGLTVSAFPDYSFTATLAPASTYFTPLNRSLGFPVPFVTETIDGDPQFGKQYAISMTVNSGQVLIYEGYVPSSNHIERRYASSYDGSSWSMGSETGITMGLKLNTACATSAR